MKINRGNLTPKILLYSLSVLIAFGFDSPLLAADYMGIYPGMDDFNLTGKLYNRGDGFYSGILGGAFTRAISFGGKVGMIEVIYDGDDLSTVAMRQFSKAVTLAQALELHSFTTGRFTPEFGFAINRNGQTYGIVDLRNEISYTVPGSLSPSSKCFAVTYLESGAPLLNTARRNPVPPEVSNQLKPAGSSANESPYSQSASGFSVSPTAMPTKMADCFSVELLDKSLQKLGIQDRLVLVLRVQNRTPKDIRGVKGEIEFVDMFGDLIKTMVLKIDDVLPAGAVKTSEYGFDFNKYVEAHRTLLTSNVRDIVVRWRPEMILFTDGTSVRKAIAPVGQ